MSDFLVQAFIFLLATIICVPLAKKLGMGSVLGYLVAGILLGPYVFHFIGQEGQDIMHATEFGVVMMLFLVGLELNPQDFWNIRKKILGFGMTQYLGTISIMIPIGIYFLDMGFGTAFAISSALAMSSTAIILQTLNEKGLSKTASGKSSFYVLLFQDIAAIPIMAILPLFAYSAYRNNAGGTSLMNHYPAWMQTIAILAAIALIFLIAKYVVNPFFRYIARLQVRELYTAFALTLVIGVSLLMQAVGLSPALGAFMAGVAMANSEYRHQLESDIESFKDLLLGVFFIAVGSTINLQLIVHKPIAVISLVVGIMLIKSLVLYLIGKVYRLKPDQNIAFVLLLSQVGEFAFVILALSFSLRLIGQEWYDLLISSTAVTMLLTPILLLIYDTWIDPYLGTMTKIDPIKNEAIPEDKSGKKIIIAGFGDFGNTVGRILKGSGFRSIVLDNDSDRVELLRKMGFNVFYGDATQLSLLKAAGADQAQYLIAAIDPPELNKKLIDVAKKNFPNLNIIIRAKDRSSVYEFYEEGFDEVYRETFFTAVHVARVLMEKLGVSHDTALKQAEIFVNSDRASLKKLAKHRHNLEDYINASKEEFDNQRKMMKEEFLKNLEQKIKVEQQIKSVVPTENKEIVSKKNED